MVIIVTVHFWTGCAFPGALLYNLVDLFGRIDNFSILPLFLCNFLDPFWYRFCGYCYMWAPPSQAPGSSYLGLYDFSGFEGLKIAIFLSVLSGFEAQKKNFCDILVQLSGFERTSFAKILRFRNGLEKVRTKDFLAQHSQGLSQNFVFTVTETPWGSSFLDSGMVVLFLIALRQFSKAESLTP